MDEERARIGDREDKEMEREREREGERGRIRIREREREREKRSELERDDDSDGREHDRKRRRRDGDHRERSRSDRHREGNEKTHSEEDSDNKSRRSREEDLEEEQRKLDEEMDKRRRRVQEWQELKLKRKKEELVASSGEPKSGKNWSLEGESEAADDMDADEIQVGGRSLVNKGITQLVEMRPESETFLRLLELLGEWSEKGKVLIFVQSQEKCDALFKDLLKHGYPCLSLHGAKDQTDRESSTSDFKSNVCNPLIATSIAARGLDVKELELVINYDVPNHYEDYVHRVGRTGCVITFLSEEDARYAPDLVKALELSEQAVPADLKALADGFMAKVNQGLEQVHGTGYGGSGFKFNDEEDEVRKAAKKAQAREYGFEEDRSDSDSDDDGIRKAGGDLSQQAAFAQSVAIAAASKVTVSAPTSTPSVLNSGTSVSLPGAVGIPIPGLIMNLQHNLAKIQADAMTKHYEEEFEINEFPQNARWKVTHKKTLGPISDWTGAAITTRGQYYPPGKIPGPGECKLYLFIEGPTESSVKKAKAEVKRVLEDITRQSLSLPGASQPSKYSDV